MPKDDPSPVKISLPLEFQQEIFWDVRDNDELVVIAPGLGLLRIVTNLLHSYDAAESNLVLLVGATDRENGWIGEALAEHAAISLSAKARGLQLVNTDMMSVATRDKMYSRGGVFSITSRILIVDFLSSLLDPAKVTGVVVLHADKVVATSLEAFILRVYRQKNKSGFLKAFSDSPDGFTRGFSPLATMMRNLFLRKPALYPRFHVTVAKSLEGKRKAEVIELEVPMTDAMKDIQTAVVECVELSISELKKANSGVEMENWNLDGALHKNFDTIVRAQLDPVWHRTSFRTRQIVRDLTMLQNILSALLTYDAVSFNRYLDTVLAASQPPPGSTRQNQSPWLFLDAAHIIFDTARRRVYTGKINEADPASGSALQPVLEEQPKWGVLAEILEEIERDAYFNPGAQGTNGAILIMVGDQGTAAQIREFLQTMHVHSEVLGRQGNDDKGLEGDGPTATYMMRRRLRNYLDWRKYFNKVSSALFVENQKSITGAEAKGNRTKAPPNKRRRIRGGGAAGLTTVRNPGGMVSLAGDREAHITSLLADLQPTEVEAAQKGEVAVDALEGMEEYYELFEMNELIVINPYDGDMDEHVLAEVKPRYIIMYEPDAAFIRRVEVYRSSGSDRNVRVYFMFYGGSVEEQRYLSAVRREKDAFTKIIKERANMALTMTADPHETEDPQEMFLRTVNTRIAGGGRLAATAEPPRVVVDVREFGSSLPSLLHGRNMIIVPCMLTVGDYVLTPDVCIERKSVSDLIQSLNNGRLYNQAETMLQHYKTPMLLIEFNQNKSFTLEPFADLYTSGGASTAEATDLQSKLVLLTLAFPRLRIIWSSSPYQTAEIFEELKKQQDEPDPVQAVQIGLQDGEDPTSKAFSQLPQEMLRAVPGVTGKNLARLTLEMDNLLEVANAEEDDISELVGKNAARQICRFFKKEVLDD